MEIYKLTQDIIMDTKTLREYAKVDAKLREYQVKRDELREKIAADMRKQKLEKAETDYGTFTRATRTEWEYTEKVEQLKEKLKTEQVREQNSGDATPRTTEYLRFTKVK